MASSSCWPKGVRRLRDYDWSSIDAKVQERHRWQRTTAAASDELSLSRICLNNNNKRKKSSSSSLRRPPIVCSSMTTSKIKFCKISDKNHPAFGQFGAFASCTIKPGELIVEYLGVVKERTEQVDSSPYALSFAPGIVVDALEAGNEARFVNDARGTGKEQNACFKTYWRLTSGGGKKKNAKRAERRIGYFCCKTKIRRGEEILTRYGKGFWSGDSG